MTTEHDQANDDESTLAVPLAELKPALEALLLVADKDTMLMLSGNGEVIEPDGDVAAIGSGGFYALSAGRAMVKHTDMAAGEIAKEALSIAADICVYTNHNIKVEELD